MTFHPRADTPATAHTYNYYYHPPPSTAMQDTYGAIRPSRKGKHRKQNQTQWRPAIKSPFYYIYNSHNRQDKQSHNQSQSQTQRQEEDIYSEEGAARGYNSSREWETEPEDTAADPATSTKQETAGNSKYTYKPPRRSFAEYIWYYAQRLRKKGKRVRFVPQPVVIPPRTSSAHWRSSSTTSSNSSSSRMGSQSSKIAAMHSSRRHSHHHGRSSGRSRRSGGDFGGVTISAPYGRTAAEAEALSGGQTFTYTYTYPQYSAPPPTYSPPLESAYYLGTEQIPALHSLGRRSPKSGHGSSSSSSGGGTPVKKTQKGKSRGRTTSPPQYQYGYYYQPEEDQTAHRHHHRGEGSRYSSTNGSGGMYVLGQDGVYYWYPDMTSTSTWAGGHGSKPSKRHREQSVGGVSSHGREKKLRRAKGVDDMRARSLRGGFGGHEYTGWVSVKV